MTRVCAVDTFSQALHFSYTRFENDLRQSFFSSSRSLLPFPVWSDRKDRKGLKLVVKWVRQPLVKVEL